MFNNNSLISILWNIVLLSHIAVYIQITSRVLFFCSSALYLFMHTCDIVSFWANKFIRRSIACVCFVCVLIGMGTKRDKWETVEDFDFYNWNTHHTQHAHKHIDKMCKQRTPPRFIAYAPQRILAHIVVYVFSLRFISLSISISCFSIFSSASQFVRPALQTVFSGNCGNHIFTYISIFVDALLWFFVCVCFG